MQLWQGGWIPFTNSQIDIGEAVASRGEDDQTILSSGSKIEKSSLRGSLVICHMFQKRLLCEVAKTNVWITCFNDVGNIMGVSRVNSNKRFSDDDQVKEVYESDA